MEWRELSSCEGADNNIFFDAARLDEAIAFCKDCPVKKHCEWDATRMRSTGVWGGTTYLQRVAKRGHEPVLINWVIPPG